jgi:hypothetical protein
MKLNRQEINAIVEKTYSIIKKELDDSNDLVKEKFIAKHRPELEKTINRYKVILDQETGINHIYFSFLDVPGYLMREKKNGLIDLTTRMLQSLSHRNCIINSLKSNLKEEIKMELILGSISLDSTDDLTTLINNLVTKFI